MSDNNNNKSNLEHKHTNRNIKHTDTTKSMKSWAEGGENAEKQKTLQREN